MSSRLLRGIVMCGLLALGGQSAAQELGDRRGLDHVAVLVRPESFDAAVDVLPISSGSRPHPPCCLRWAPRTA